MIVSAIATLSLEAIGGNLAPFLILSIVGIFWNVAAFLLLAPRMILSYWFERGMGDFGQSMGMTASGLLLMKIADPETGLLLLKALDTNSSCLNQLLEGDFSQPLPFL